VFIYFPLETTAKVRNTCDINKFPSEINYWKAIIAEKFLVGHSNFGLSTEREMTDETEQGKFP
jgi:hypothetical protein